MLHQIRNAKKRRILWQCYHENKILYFNVLYPVSEYFLIQIEQKFKFISKSSRKLFVISPYQENLAEIICYRRMKYKQKNLLGFLSICEFFFFILFLLVNWICKILFTKKNKKLKILDFTHAFQCTLWIEMGRS